MEQNNKPVSALQKKLLAKLNKKTDSDAGSQKPIEEKQSELNSIQSKLGIKTYQDAVTRLNKDFIEGELLIPYFVSSYEITEDPEKKLDNLFYWLIALLRSSITESIEANKKYKIFIKKFHETREHIYNNYKKNPQDKIISLTLKLFIKKYIHNLMQLSSFYEKIGHKDYIDEIYILRKDLQRLLCKIEKEYVKYSFFSFDRLTSLYGTSARHLSIHVLSVSIIYAILLYLVDPKGAVIKVSNPIWSDFLFGSVRVLTNLGGDFQPVSTAQNLIFSVGAIYGLIIFSLIMSLIGIRNK